MFIAVLFIVAPNIWELCGTFEKQPKHQAIRRMGKYSYIQTKKPRLLRKMLLQLTSETPLQSVNSVSMF